MITDEEVVKKLNAQLTNLQEEEQRRAEELFVTRESIIQTARRS